MRSPRRSPRNDMLDLRDELGDLLLQVVYHARHGRGRSARSPSPTWSRRSPPSSSAAIPHVFGDDEARAAGAAKGFWEKIKAEEKAARRGRARRRDEPAGLLYGVARGQPPLTRALKLQEKASTVGFDWNDPRAVLAKLREEIGEIEEVLAEPVPSDDRLEDEVGDLLFVVVNLARHLKVDPEQALRRTNAKFETRFAAIEAALAKQGRTPAEASLDEMEALWQAAKRGPKGG